MRALSIGAILIDNLCSATGLADAESPRLRFHLPSFIAGSREEQDEELLRRVRLSFRSTVAVELLRHEYVSFVLMGCSEQERELLAGLPHQMTSSIARSFLRYLPIADEAPVVTILCLGGEAPVRMLPRQVVECIGEAGHMAAWFSSLLCVVFSLPRFRQGGEPLLGVISHELGHAYLQTLAGAYSFVSVVSEAMARAMEVRFAYDKAWFLPPSMPVIKIPCARPMPSHNTYYSFSDLMQLGSMPSRSWPPVRNALYRLLLFLATANYPQGPITGFLYKQRALQLKQEALSGWLCGAFRVSERDMDRAFERFCREGIVSLGG